MLTSSMDEAVINFLGKCFYHFYQYQIMITVFVFRNPSVQTDPLKQQKQLNARSSTTKDVLVIKYASNNKTNVCVYHGVRLALSIRTQARSGDPRSAELSPPFFMRTLNGRSRRTVASVLMVFPELQLEGSFINITFLLITPL